MKIVEFKAFDKTCFQAFMNNESVMEMHAVLKKICFTYVPINVFTVQITGTNDDNLVNLLNLNK